MELYFGLMLAMLLHSLKVNTISIDSKLMLPDVVVSRGGVPANSTHAASFVGFLSTLLLTYLPVLLWK